MMHIVILALLAGTPLLLAVLGETVLEQSGIINIGLEGILLGAALGAAICANASGSAIVGIAGGIAGAAIVATIFGVMTIELSADQIVVGTAMNFFALGATSVVARELASRGITLDAVPSLASITRASGGVDLVSIFSWTIAPFLVAFFLWRTRTGLRIRACGESPESVSSNGLSVRGYRWLALTIETLLAGTGGAYIALALASGFAENMVSGRGFIALAVVIFGRWRSRGAVAGVALFSAAIAAQYALQAANSRFPFHVLLALPYVVTLLVLAGAGGRVHAPAALGKKDSSQQ